MPQIPAEQVSPYTTEHEVAALIRVNVETLRRWRREGRGPSFRKFGSRVLYHRDEVLAWAEAQRRISTHHPAQPAAS